jgi:hypothetical protein
LAVSAPEHPNDFKKSCQGIPDNDRTCPYKQELIIVRGEPSKRLTLSDHRSALSYLWMAVMGPCERGKRHHREVLSSKPPKVAETLARQNPHDQDPFHGSSMTTSGFARIGAFHPHSLWLCVVGPIRSSSAQLSRAEEMEEVMKVLVAIASIVGSAIMRGFTLAVLWGWFIAGPEAPFHGLPQLSIVNAIGLALVVGFVTNHGNSNPREDSRPLKSFGDVLLEALIKDFIELGVVWATALSLHAMQT